MTTKQPSLQIHPLRISRIHPQPSDSTATAGVKTDRTHTKDLKSPDAIEQTLYNALRLMRDRVQNDRTRPTAT